MYLDRVIAPGVVRELHDTVFCLYERDLNHLVGTIEIAAEGIHRLGIVKTDASVLVLTRLHPRDVEGWMTSYLEMDLAGISVIDMPDNTDLIIIEHITDGEGEVVGIHLLGLFRRLESEGHFTSTLSDKLEICIASKTMTWQMVFLAIDAIGIIVDTAHDREEDR